MTSKRKEKSKYLCIIWYLRPITYLSLFYIVIFRYTLRDDTSLQVHVRCAIGTSKKKLDVRGPKIPARYDAFEQIIPMKY